MSPVYSTAPGLGSCSAQLWTFLPLILQFGLATEEIDIDMLAE
jgi:hypothetical protein